MLPGSLTITTRSTLSHEVDVEARIAACPADHAVKGMFFTRLVDMAMKAGVRPEDMPLTKPVAEGRYVAFLDYPLKDYVRWTAAAGKKLHGRVPMSEALRRVAQADFGQFLASGVGKVMVEFMSDARSVMIRSGQIYGLVVKGPTITTREEGKTVIVSYRNYHGPVECYPAGTLEGACRHFDAPYEIFVDILSPTAADYHVRLG